MGRNGYGVRSKFGTIHMVRCCCFHEFHVFIMNYSRFFHEFHVFLTHSCTHGDSSPEQKSRFSHELYVSFHEFDVVFHEFHVFFHDFHVFFMNFIFPQTVYCWGS